MRLFWTLTKIVLGLALIIPIGIIAASLALGILGALVGLAVMVVRVAVLGVIAYGAFRLFRLVIGGESKRTIAQRPVKELVPVDPHYEAAMRELDRELGIPR